jgi:hypothetical protein
VVLDLELDARALAGDDEPANDAALKPELSLLADDDAVGLDAVKVGVEALDDIDLLDVGDKTLLTLPYDADGCADMVFDAGEALAKFDGRWGLGRNGELEEEGGDALASGVVVCGQRVLACERMGKDSVGGRYAGALV